MQNRWKTISNFRLADVIFINSSFCNSTFDPSLLHVYPYRYYVSVPVTHRLHIHTRPLFIYDLSPLPLDLEVLNRRRAGEKLIVRIRRSPVALSPQKQQPFDRSLFWIVPVEPGPGRISGTKRGTGARSNVWQEECRNFSLRF